MSDEIDVVDETYSKQEKFSIKQIILRHIQKISDLSCQELTPSYWEEKPVKVGEGMTMSKVYHQDLRLAYCNAVDFLLDIIRPYIQDDKEKVFENRLNEIDEEEESSYNEAGRKEIKMNDWFEIKLKLRRKLFGEIILLLNRINFFESASYGE